MLVMLAMQSATQHLGECSGCCSSWAPAVIPMSGQGMGFGNVWHWQSIVSWHSLCSSTGNRQCPPMVISLQMKIENKKPPPSPPPNTFG